MKRAVVYSFWAFWAMGCARSGDAGFDDSDAGLVERAASISTDGSIATPRDAEARVRDAAAKEPALRCEECAQSSCAAGHQCGSVGATKRCVPSCAADGGCPSGFECSAGACAPLANVCCVAKTDAGSAAGSELCNRADDDCDGVIDKGCPRAAQVCCESVGSAVGGTSGAAFTAPCAQGRVLVGFDGRASATRLEQLAPVCAEAFLDAIPGVPESAFRLRVRAPSVLDAHGGAGGAPFSDRCPPDEIVVGISGRSGSDIDQLGFQCGSVTLARSGATWGPVIAPRTTSGARGGTGGGPFVYDCPSGHVAVGADGNSGTLVHRLALRCGRVTVTTQ